ncbi:DNA recombination protein RmuC [Aureimonas pseudogalii]|uniref:DNA recombination protein RmuC homolog n=1 Tax=Aureimonas pseudogalii TaxID=1744844 RepID=A0A7W6E841_9HYPH|nr:DNA recombination protein RmuC [Aureimonas pseudogalii]MBB3996475.1 DNA recombination protein RmuC [Aureimonas pseudogalii]
MDFAALAPVLDHVLFVVFGHGVTLGEIAFALAVLWGLLRLARSLRHAGDDEPSGEEEARSEAILRSQAELAGRLQSMGEMLGARQAELARSVGERLDGMGVRVGRSLSETQVQTGETLSRLAERLAVIDRAQGQIRDLAGEVVRLQDILSNKQARGAFGQGRMEAIVMDALPRGAYSFQATLSNGKRPDCVIPMPNGAPSLVIDAKFPLEAWTAFREAASDEARSFAAGRMRRDMEVHIRAIAEKYLLPGETQDTAFLFVPSESVFAELNEHFEDVIRRAHRARVVIVSPSLLMLSIEVVRALLKDQRMRQEAGRIQKEVALLAEDLQRLDQRMASLKTHFGQTGRDIDQILVSTEKLIRRGERIARVEVEADEADASPGGMTTRLG